MTSFLDQLPDHHDASLVKSEDRIAASQQQEALIQSVQDKLFFESISVVNDTLRFREVDPSIADVEAQPNYKVWLEECGGDVEAVARMFRVALAGWLGAKEAPSAVKYAATIAVGIIKSKATEKSSHKTLNVGKVYVNIPERQYPIITVEEK